MTGTDYERDTAEKYDLGVTLQLTLSITDDGTLVPGFTYLDGPFSFGTGFKLERSRQQEFTEQLFYRLSEVKNLAKTLGAQKECGGPVDTDLAGNIGLKEAYDLALTTGTGLKLNATGIPGVFGGTVTFIVKRELGATGPTWALRHFKGPGAFATASDDGQDKLLFAFTAGDPSGKKGIGWAKSEQGANLARAAGEAFLQTLVQTQIATSLSSISQALK